MRRRCAWLPTATRTPARIVWARKHVSTEVCPKSFITPQSLAWLERFFVWRKLKGLWNEETDGRETEAFLILEAEWAAEASND